MSLADYPLIRHWITANDDRLVVHTGKVDIGQRITTALVRIAHEELTLPAAQIAIAPVCTGHAPNEGITSGSNSIEQSGHALRRAAASLRTRLVALAAGQTGTDPASWELSDGILHAPATNHRLPLLDLIPNLPDDLPVDPDAPLRAPVQQDAPHIPMRGLHDMVRGRYTFVHDLHVGGMHHARVIRPPHALAHLTDLAGSAVQKITASGMTLTRDGSFLALSGPQEWPVAQAAQKLALACTWETGEGLPETDVFHRLAPENATRFAVIHGTPAPDTPIPDPIASPDLAARYERPYQMHGALAPSAALALWTGQRLTLHSHSQGIYPLRDSIADSLGLTPEQVEIIHCPGSGCYGHSGADDAAFEAALIAIARPDVPILLKWTREDEHAWEPYAPAMAVSVAATLSDGTITGFSAESYSDTHRGRPRAGPDRAGPKKLLANRFRADPIGPATAVANMGTHAGMHRNLEPIYRFRDLRLVKNLVSGLPHRTSAMRCLGGAANVFAIESFLDEMAHAHNLDPIDLRKAHLTDPRALAVLDTLENRISDLPRLDGRGIAYAQYKNQMTRVGLCVDISTNDRAEIRLNRATIVADAGRVVDPDGLVAQLEGGFIQAASWALYEQVTWDRDGITSRDWDSYPVIRFDNIPDIRVTLLDHPEDMSRGAGEASPGPTIAAIANAIHDATGIRMRRMPFTPEAILQTALNA